MHTGSVLCPIPASVTPTFVCSNWPHDCVVSEWITVSFLYSDTGSHSSHKVPSHLLPRSIAGCIARANCWSVVRFLWHIVWTYSNYCSSAQTSLLLLQFLPYPSLVCPKGERSTSLSCERLTQALWFPSAFQISFSNIPFVICVVFFWPYTRTFGTPPDSVIPLLR